MQNMFRVCACVCDGARVCAQAALVSVSGLAGPVLRPVCAAGLGVMFALGLVLHSRVCPGLMSQAVGRKFWVCMDGTRQHIMKIGSPILLQLVYRGSQQNWASQ